MSIPLSSLPRELQEKILGQKPKAARKATAKALPGTGGRWCACGSMMIRPDGAYPKDCPGCRKPWKVVLKKGRRADYRCPSCRTSDAPCGHGNEPKP